LTAVSRPVISQFRFPENTSGFVTGTFFYFFIIHILLAKKARKPEIDILGFDLEVGSQLVLS
jgi:hypothetical protein